MCMMLSVLTMLIANASYSPGLPRRFVMLDTLSITTDVIYIQVKKVIVVLKKWLVC